MNSIMKYWRLPLLLCLCSLAGTPALEAHEYPGMVPGITLRANDSLSYENYNRMLDEASRVPLSDIPRDSAPDYLKEQVKWMKGLHGNDKRAFAATREQLSEKKNNPAIASNLKKNAGLRNTNVNDLESVYNYFDDLELKLVEELGPKNFIHQYIALKPVLSHLAILREAKLREFMDKDDHVRYFLKSVLPHTPCRKGPVVAGDEFKCTHSLRMPIFTGGNVVQWLRQNVKYPIEAQERNLQAKVVVSYVVDVDGSVTDVRIVTGSVLCLNQEAIRVVKTMKYIPARCLVHKTPCRVNYSIPVHFQLSSPSL